jgi:diaminobutyrate-2-oxoglutarate transaminase
MSIAHEASQQENETFLRLESNVQSYARTFPRVFTRALGTEVWDVQGRRYLDFLAGAGSLNYGHNNPILKEALISYIQEDGLTHSLDLYTPAKETFLEAIEDVLFAPRGLDYVVQFTGPTGTNAVEAALKIARKVTGRTNVISFTNGFHGVSVGALAATGNQHFRGAAGVALQGVTVMPYDGYFGSKVDTIACIDRMLTDPSSGVDEPAAMLIELVQGEGGLNAARLDWLKRLQALCDRKGILLIVDDVQAGCGRTGTFFSFEAAGLTPDIVTMSKSISGYGLPMAIVLIARKVDQWRPGEHNGTFRGNNHAFITAAAALENYWRTPDFVEDLQAKGDHLAERLQTFVDRHPDDLLEVRGRGMMRGVVCADPNLAAKITASAFERGLIIERAGPYDEVIKCLMPLTTPLEQLDEGLDILGSAMDEVFSAPRPKQPAAGSVLQFSTTASSS